MVVSKLADTDVDFDGLESEMKNEQFTNTAKHLFSISRITENLYLCGACAIRADTFEKLGITCVINCTTRDELPDPPLPDLVTTYRRIPVKDSGSTNLLSYFNELSDLIHKVSQSDGKTLVHCIAGVSRSVSICIAYLIKYKNMSLKDAHDYIVQKRPCINPNIGFFEQLIAFEMEITRRTSVALVYHAITQTYIPDIYDTQRICSQLKISPTRTY